jgi:hypothetical protein
MAFATYEITDGNVSDARADLDHLTGELVPHGHWWLQGLLRPFIPALDV